MKQQQKYIKCDKPWLRREHVLCRRVIRAKNTSWWRHSVCFSLLWSSIWKHPEGWGEKGWMNKGDGGWWWVLGRRHDLVRAVFRLRRRFGLRGGFGFGRPVWIHAEFLGQMHVACFGHLHTPATQPRAEPGRTRLYSFLHTNTRMPQTEKTQGEEKGKDRDNVFICLSFKRFS